MGMGRTRPADRDGPRPHRRLTVTETWVKTVAWAQVFTHVRGSTSAAGDRDRGRRPQGLGDDAVALGGPRPGAPVVALVGVGVDLDAHPRWSVKPTGTSRSTPSVPRASQSPSTTCTRRRPQGQGPIAAATERSVTAAQPASASSSMSPLQASDPSPPVAGCRPARATPGHWGTSAATASSTTWAVADDDCPGGWPRSARERSLSGRWRARRAAACSWGSVGRLMTAREGTRASHHRRHRG